ncbi:hypothetical protein VKT23_012335 [Stygiomarasmius scandens]|uniref:Uncharacterized protein n=1 Tax=Marasmiellus scandens TaxID=2682957 RepID=A0ABR1J9A8_9AGAR
MLELQRAFRVWSRYAEERCRKPSTEATIDEVTTTSLDEGGASGGRDPMPLSSADEYFINMTTRQILDRADLPISSVEDLHPPPPLPVPYFGHKDSRAIAKIWILTRAAPDIAENVLEFLDRVGPNHNGHKMAFNMWDNECDGNVTLTCSCGVCENFGALTFVEDLNFEILVSTWEREEKVLKEHKRCIEYSAELSLGFHKIIEELAELQRERENNASK